MNADRDKKHVSGMIVHEGFYRYLMLLKPCIDAYLQGNNSPPNGRVHYAKPSGMELDFVVGHSLGGAAATLWWELSSSLRGNSWVITFGAPPTRHTPDPTCTASGYRFFHKNDPVASNVMGFMEEYNHDVEKAIKLSEKCVSYNWWGTCDRYEDHHEHVGCTEKAGGCSFLLDCAYYASKRHSTYDQHVDSAMTLAHATTLLQEDELSDNVAVRRPHDEPPAKITLLQKSDGSQQRIIDYGAYLSNFEFDDSKRA